MFLFYWELYALLELVENLQNEDLHWFSEKRIFIDGGVYMRISGRVGSRNASSVIFKGFFSRTLTNHMTAEEGGGHFFNSSLPIPPASQTLRH